MEKLKKFKVKFLPEDKDIEVSSNTDLLNAAIKMRINLRNSCGGKGLCGKCKLKIISGEYETKSTFNLRSQEIQQGYVLACQTYPRSDLVVEIPSESLEVKPQVVKAGLDIIEEDVVKEESLGDKFYPLDPIIKVEYLRLEKPQLENNLPDLERIQQAMEKKVNIPIEILKKLPFILRNSDWDIKLTYFDNFVLDISGEKDKRGSFVLACDLGTTTVVVHLLDLSCGKTLNTKAEYNRQILIAEDIISRIIVGEEEQGLQELKNLALETINELIARICQEMDISPSEINAILISGNTTMVHLVLGLPPNFIRRFPYTPVFKSELILHSHQAGIDINPLGVVIIMPGIRSFVGSDIVAGILASGMDRGEELSLLVDLGTNGEVVLGNKEWLISCSTSAGPCFEGGGLSCGVRAMAGAIQKISIVNDKLTYTTISQEKPIGICGTGIVELIAELFLNKIIDKNGNFIPGSSSRIRTNEYGELEYVVVRGSESKTGKDIAITQSDIKNVIYSKAAIYLGIEVLLEKMGLNVQDIHNFYIAGGLGTYLDVEKAVIIGLLPDIPRNRFKFLGNTSIQGARLCLCSQSARRRAQDISEMVTNLELSNVPEFLNNYSSALFLPHTDINKFPSVKERLQK